MNDVVERYESSFNYEEFEVNNEEKEYFIGKEQELTN